MKSHSKQFELYLKDKEGLVLTYMIRFALRIIINLKINIL